MRSRSKHRSGIRCPNGSRRILAELPTFFLLIIAFVQPSLAQTIPTKTAKVTAELHTKQKRNPKLWKWTKERNHLDSVVALKVDRSSATGVVVRINPAVKKSNGFECYILTAYHVVEPRKSDESISVEYRNGQSIKECKVIAFDDRHDIALLKTWAPKGVKAAFMADAAVEHKMYLEFAGLGGSADLDESMRHFEGRATQPTNQKFIYADETLLPGDSGGPVFNKQKQLVGIISGGWFWWDAGIKSTEGVPVLSTWPARASNLESIRDLMRENIPEEPKLASND